MHSWKVKYRYKGSTETHTQGVFAQSYKSAKNKVQRQIGNGGKVIEAKPLAKRKFIDGKWRIP